MKSLFLPVCLLMLFAACSPVRKWGDVEREKVKIDLRAYRDGAPVLSAVPDSVFDTLAAHIVRDLSDAYPDYGQFAALPAAQDTAVHAMMARIGGMIRHDPQTLALLFPPAELARRGILPGRLDRDQQITYYNCLAGKLRGAYPSTEEFLFMVAEGRLSSRQLDALLRPCAVEMGAVEATELEMAI
ncbi:MAG: hypothetical protein IJC16_09675 [Rikenellaceae bacterium]|nr:hypothetical protein [Rikenellaceae bacterium]